MQEVLDGLTVEVDKSDKWLDLSHTCQGWPVTNASYFDRVHLHPIFWKDKTKILYCGLSEHAFLSFKVELMPAEDIQDPYYDDMVLLLGLATEDEDVVYVND